MTAYPHPMNGHEYPDAEPGTHRAFGIAAPAPIIEEVPAWGPDTAPLFGLVLADGAVQVELFQ